MALRDARWRKSTRSSNNDGCVEVALLNGAVGMRDSKNRNGPVLMFPTAGWIAFIAAVQSGEITPPF